MFLRTRNLKWMHTATAGVEGILFPEIITSPIPLTNAKGVYSHSLAEYALAGCNWFAKDFLRMRASQAAKKWDHFAVEELRGRTMGIIGLGDIGFAIGKLAKAFKMRVVGLRRNTTLNEEEQAIIVSRERQVHSVKVVTHGDKKRYPHRSHWYLDVTMVCPMMISI